MRDAIRIEAEYCLIPAFVVSESTDDDEDGQPTAVAASSVLEEQQD